MFQADDTFISDDEEEYWYVNTFFHIIFVIE